MFTSIADSASKSCGLKVVVVTSGPAVYASGEESWQAEEESLLSRFVLGSPEAADR